MSFNEDQWSIEDMGLSDNLMLIAPTNNIIYESFEEAIKNLSQIMN